MKPYTIALFGEAEKGEYRTAYYCENLPQILEFLGNPPPDSQGLDLAIQTILYEHKVLFFRVQEEGYSEQDYYSGIHFLKTQKLFPKIAGICAPGVGDTEIIDAIVPLCHSYQSILMTTESDLYDYLTT